MRNNKTSTQQNLFEINDYRIYLKQHLQLKTRGELGRMARAIQVSPTLLSLIVKGEKNLSAEQALDLCDYFIFAELESEYFMSLVEFSRAGTQKLKKRLQNKISFLRTQALQLSKRIKKDKDLKGESASIYYSSWLYTGIRNFASIEGGITVQEVAKKFSIPNQIVHSIVQFLLEHNLLIEKNGVLSYGAKNTHLSSYSPWVNQQHKNWRIKGFEQMEMRKESDLFYTCPMSLSHEDVIKIRQLLPEFIQQIQKIVGPSKSETVMCWNMDWFQY